MELRNIGILKSVVTTQTCNVVINPVNINYTEVHEQLKERPKSNLKGLY